MPTRKRLLIVDDDAHIRRLLALYLRGEPWDIAQAATGDEALELIEEGGWDAILLDLILPQHGGFRLCQRVRARKHERPWIIIMTADGAPETREMAMECGADEFLVKPFEPEAVVEMLRKRVKG